MQYVVGLSGGEQLRLTPCQRLQAARTIHGHTRTKTFSQMSFTSSTIRLDICKLSNRRMRQVYGLTERDQKRSTQILPSTRRPKAPSNHTKMLRAWPFGCGHLTANLQRRLQLPGECSMFPSFSAYRHTSHSPNSQGSSLEPTSTQV